MAAVKLSTKHVRRQGGSPLRRGTALTLWTVLDHVRLWQFHRRTVHSMSATAAPESRSSTNITAARKQQAFKLHYRHRRPQN